MKKSHLKKLIREEISKVLNEKEIPTIELNTSFLQSQDDFDKGGDSGYTVWKPEFKSGLKSTQQNFQSSGKPAIPAQKIKFTMMDTTGGDFEDMPYINIKFKKPLNEVFIDLDDYDAEEFGVEDEDKLDEIVESKQNPTLQDIYELIDLKNPDLSFYGVYVLDIKPSEIIEIKKEI
tara:strand:+ start:3750 stop:4277 length:528 start_codon:yes stop_codon:yes gene_type:complete